MERAQNLQVRLLQTLPPGLGHDPFALAAVQRQEKGQGFPYLNNGLLPPTKRPCAMVAQGWFFIKSPQLTNLLCESAQEKQRMCVQPPGEHSGWSSEEEPFLA